MSLTRISPVILLIVSAAVTPLVSTPTERTRPKYEVLHAFTGGKDGGGLWGSLVLDRQGNLYGTTSASSPKGGGTVFKLTPKANRGWTQKVLYSFCSQPSCGDGGNSTAGLTFDPLGNLYGTTRLGGTKGYGVVFKLTRGSGGWAESVLYNFPLPGGGCCPYGGVVMDQSGNLFGATYSGFELTPNSKGWSATVLHSFTGRHGDGSGPFAGPILDAAGNLYGTTELGGTSKNCGEGTGCGTVYKLHPIGDGSWKETILHSFNAQWDGAFPGVGALVLDGAGNLYGTADGGTTGYGVIFRLAPGSDGHWEETVLYNLTGGANGDHPGAGVVMDKAGNLYGTTIAGGSGCDCGVVYKLAPGKNGEWTYTVLHTFVGSDGAEPDANLILGDKGNLFGTTATGGSGGYGVVFEITP